ncbi:MAG TPA: hypothetical protein VEK15_10380 [Vicinamibacteria bacterium]|nr:hypothetical protein [Vicinamibacteria bacterium]
MSSSRAASDDQLPVTSARTPSALPGQIARVFLIAALLFAVYLIQVRIDESFGEYRATEEILYVESGETLKKVTLGFENLVADLYWLRTVQYFGGKRRQVTNKNYALLEPLLRITTDLDPDFKIAYTYGSTFLSEPFPSGAGLPIKGIELIDRGIANHPDYWRFYLDKGFIYFWYLKDYHKAAEIFLEGSKIEGAPYWMVATASRTLTKGGEREVARELWRYLYETAETNQQRENAAIHLRQLDALDQMDRLRETVRRFAEDLGRAPQSWQELVDAKYLRARPVDPAGVPYVLDPSKLDVTVSKESSLSGLQSIR